MGNFQNCDSYINIPSSQTYSHLMWRRQVPDVQEKAIYLRQVVCCDVKVRNSSDGRPWGGFCCVVWLVLVSCLSAGCCGGGVGWRTEDFSTEWKSSACLFVVRIVISCFCTVECQ
jgi:hypothetical protein